MQISNNQNQIAFQAKSPTVFPRGVGKRERKAAIRAIYGLSADASRGTLLRTINKARAKVLGIDQRIERRLEEQRLNTTA